MPISLDGSGSISGISTFSFSDEIIHTGDTNTAIKFPANDTISFETSGNERLRITSAGDMGLGTNSPENFGGGYVTLEVAGSTNDHGGVFKSATSGSAGSGSSGIEMLMNTDPVGGSINVVTSHPLKFATANTERLRIDAGGGLQLGTSTATASKLTVYGANDAAAIFQGSGTGTGAANGFLVGNNGGTDGLLWNYENGNTKIATNNVERLRIDSSGHLKHTGIRSGNSQNKLAILSAPSYNTSEEDVIIYQAENEVSSNQLSIGGGTSSRNAMTALSFRTASAVNTTGGDERLRITSSDIIAKSSVGHVLLGTDTARTFNTHSGRLQVTGTTYSHSTISVINNEANGNGAYLFLGKQRSGAVGGSSAVQEHDIIGELRFPAGDGTDMENYAARIIVKADSNATSNNTAGYMEFYTTRRNGSSNRKIRIGQNTNHGTQFSFGSENDLNNSSTPDRTSLKVGPTTHIEGVFGHNGTPGMYYNCYSGGNELFYRGTRAPSGGDWRPCAYGQKYGQHYFYGDNSSTAWSAQQQITTMQTNMYITSHGYVRKQYQPAFDAVRTAGTVPDNANQRIVFNSTLTNVGNHYNTSTGYFTAPTVGTYLFSFFGMNNNGLAWYNFRKNNSIINPQHGTYQTNGTDWSSVGMTIVIVLAANDTMAVYTGNSNSVGMYGQGNNHNGFCGYMLG